MFRRTISISMTGTGVSSSRRYIGVRIQELQELQNTGIPVCSAISSLELEH
jgi:hypothetical protein